MKILLLLPLLLGLMSPAIAHNIFNGGAGLPSLANDGGGGFPYKNAETEEGDEGEEDGIRYRGNIEK